MKTFKLLAMFIALATATGLSAEALDIPASIKTIKDLSLKYRLTPEQVKEFARLAKEIGKKENFANLSSEQTETYKAAMEMAKYGMIFESALSDSDWNNPDVSITNKDGATQTLSDWTSFSTSLGELSGSKAGEKPTEDGFTEWTAFLADEVGRHESLSAENITKLTGEEKLMPLSGQGSITAKLTELVTRRMEAPLALLSTSGGLALSTFQAKSGSGDSAAPPDGYEELKSSPKDSTDTAICFVESLEDPASSWTTLRNLVTEARRIIYLPKSKIGKAEKAELADLLFGLEKRLGEPITIEERVSALKTLVETGALTNDKEFEVRLAKLVDSISSQASEEQKQSIVELIDRFAIVGQTEKSRFQVYIRILTEGRHPSELFSAEQMVAFLWDEQDGTQPKQKFMKATDDKSLVEFADKDVLHENAHFKLITTDEAEVIVYLQIGDTKYILDNEGTLESGNPEGAADNQKFYVYGSKSAFSLKSKVANHGFLTVNFEKRLYSQKGDKPAGKLKDDGSLEPGAWGVFKIVEISPLHQELVKIRTGTSGWRDKDWSADRLADKAAAQTLATSIINKFKEIAAETDSSGADTDFNADLIIREVSNFFQKAFRVNPEQWDWFGSSGLKTLATTLVTLLESSMSEAIAANGQAKKSIEVLKQKVTSPPEQTLEPHEDAPADGQVVALFVEKNGQEMFMRVVQETDAQGTHSYLKADVTDPVDARCHLRVVTQGNKLGFAFSAPDGSTQTLHHISRTDSELKRYWADATGQAVIKRMSRLKFSAAGQGDFNSKDRAAEQFQMDYHDKASKGLSYLFNNMAKGAGVLMIDPDGYAVAVKPNVSAKKLNPTSKATDSAMTNVKMLPISGFVTELGKLRDEPDAVKAVNGYTEKIDIVETNQDIEFLIMEFENFISLKQTKRDDWLKLSAKSDVTDAINEFLDKVTPRATGDLAATLTDMKQTYAQADDGGVFYTNKSGAKVAKTMAIKWTSPEGEDWYLMVDEQGKVGFLSDDYTNPSSHFVMDRNYAAAISTPLKFSAKIKALSGSVAATATTTATDYLAQRGGGSIPPAATPPAQPAPAPTPTPSPAPATP